MSKIQQKWFQKINMGKPVQNYFASQIVLRFATAVQYGKQTWKYRTVKGQKGNKAKHWITLNCNVKRTWKERPREFILFNRWGNMAERNTNSKASHTDRDLLCLKMHLKQDWEILLQPKSVNSLKYWHNQNKIQVSCWRSILCKILQRILFSEAFYWKSKMYMP